MSDRRMVNPKVLLLVGAAVLVITSAIAIFLAVGYTPETTPPGSPTGSVSVEPSP